jgi:hypothetical protein
VFGTFSSINTALTYIDASGAVTTSAGSAVAAVYLDADKSTWTTANATDAQKGFTLSSMSTSAVSVSALRAMAGEEEGRVDMILLPEGISGPVVGSEDDTAGEGY